MYKVVKLAPPRPATAVRNCSNIESSAVTGSGSDIRHRRHFTAEAVLSLLKHQVQFANNTFILSLL